LKRMDKFAEEAEDDPLEDEEDMDDLYGGMASDDDEEGEEGEEGEEDEEDDDEEADEATLRARRRAMAMDEGSSDDDEEGDEGASDGMSDGDDEEDDDGRTGGASSKPMSAHERQQERMRTKLTKLEQQQLAEKPWQLTGEVNAQKRPKNSLLEADLDFEQGSKAAPVITEEVRATAARRRRARAHATHARAPTTDA